MAEKLKMSEAQFLRFAAFLEGSGHKPALIERARLRFVDQLTYDEIGQRVGVTSKNAWQSVTAAKKLHAAYLSLIAELSRE